MYIKKSHIHFVGIGGIGMSGIAKILHMMGYQVSGCDLDHEQLSIKELKLLGCTIYKGNNSKLCHDSSIDIIVYSSAISMENSEIVEAQKRGIPTIPRAMMLAELMRMKYSIAIAGSHGKTTTTSMVSHILLEANYDPTVIIGGHLHSISTNAQWGKGDFLVAEADESDRSLIRLHPTLAVITNIDLEHLDVYKNLEDIQSTFRQFLSNIPFYGKAIICGEDKNSRSLLPLPYNTSILYGFDSAFDIYGTDIILEPYGSHCMVWYKSQQLGKLSLLVPGKHNLLNAFATIAIALEIGIPFTTIQKGFQTFKGVDRRFTLRALYKGAEIYDDYGHHPTEMEITIQIAKQRCKGRLIVFFQPHRYSRTYHLWDQFLKTLTHLPIDVLIVTDIHSAQETAIPNITSLRMVEELQKKKPSLNAKYIPFEASFKSLLHELKSIVEKDDLVLLLGAGKLYKLADYIKAH